jgi:hypothetical protein
MFNIQPPLTVYVIQITICSNTTIQIEERIGVDLYVPHYFLVTSANTARCYWVYLSIVPSRLKVINN